MEEKGVNSSGDTVKDDEGFQMVGPRSENHGSQVMTGSAPAPSRSPAVAPPPPQAEVMMMKKKGRPRKDAALSMALSPMPISASIPFSGDYSAWRQSAVPPTSYSKKKHKLEFGNPGEPMACSVGGNFTPHVLTVGAGEDVTKKIISFAQQGCRAICVLAANGMISNVTLRQPSSFGGTLTYEGRFEILSLTGSFTPSEMGETKSRSGGMSVSLSGPDGRVIGGGLAGMLIAAAPIQVVVGSFLPGQPPRKLNIYENIPSINGAVFGQDDMQFRHPPWAPSER